MTHSQHDLLDLLGSRICHDLISPLGAISNGVELLSMNGSAAGPEMTLISESVENANARIRFFRICFGSAAPSQKISQDEVRSILQAISRDGRFAYDWRPTGDLPRMQVKLAFLILQCFESAMPRGGRISVSLVGSQWAILGEAQMLKTEPDFWQALTAPESEATPEAAQIHFALAPLVAAALDRHISVDTSPATIRVRF